MNEYQEDAQEKGKKIANELTSALNGMSYSKDVIECFVKGVTSSHRTLQQLSMGAIFSLMMRWAEMEESGCFDLRNEATVKFCKQVKELAEKENVAFPFI